MVKTYDDYLKSPEFKKAKLLLQEGKHGSRTKAAYIALSVMNLDRYENNPNLYPHINDRKLAAKLGMTNEVGRGSISAQRQLLKQERGHIEKIVKNVNTSKVKVIGSGSESVYLYYFPTYQLFNKLCLEVPYFPCNIGRTTGDVKTRVSDQIGQQLPEKARIALIIRTDDCEALEKKIHEKLKRENLEDTVGEEWFLTNPAEVESIFEFIQRKR